MIIATGKPKVCNNKTIIILQIGIRCKLSIPYSNFPFQYHSIFIYVSQFHSNTHNRILQKRKL